jgi:hypothetical protein
MTIAIGLDLYQPQRGKMLRPFHGKWDTTLGQDIAAIEAKGEASRAEVGKDRWLGGHPR